MWISDTWCEAVGLIWSPDSGIKVSGRLPLYDLGYGIVAQIVQRLGDASIAACLSPTAKLRLFDLEATTSTGLLVVLT